MNIYCSGIGGIGLSAYAAHRKAQGHTVSGSDKADSALLDDLRSQGIGIILNQDGSGLPDALDLLVYSEAIPENAPERLKASERGVRQISYFHALGEMTAGTDLISICGTHGKSSTTAMAAKMLIDCGRDPNVVVGTKLKDLAGRNWRRSESKNNLWVVESCEYRKSFHFLSPKIILLTNADGDHFDAFGSYEEYRKAFIEFMNRLPADGVIITHGNDPQCMAIANASGRKIIDADQEPLIKLAVPGLHMQQNAQLVLALAKHLQIDKNKAEQSLGQFAGTWRRMEVKGKTSEGAIVVDDYAHHPKEIRATLSAMKDAYPSKRIIAVFQPHTHDRTLKLWNDFTSAFSDADQIFVTDIYDARPDKDKELADVHAFAAAIEKESRKPTEYIGNMENAENFLRSASIRINDVLVIMGAGTSTQLAQNMICK